MIPRSYDRPLPRAARWTTCVIIARLAHLSAERKRLPLIGEFRARPLTRNPLDDVIAAHRLERHVPADIFTAAVGKQGAGVAYGQRAQQQPLTADGVRGAQRPGMDPDTSAILPCP